MGKKTLLSWSSGKDCAHTLRQNLGIEVGCLFCAVNQAFNRVAMHGVRAELLQRQARCVGLPLQIIEIPYPCSNNDCARVMRAFGDIFLPEVRRYREKRLAGSGITPLFPL
jgi:diphthamide synthase (EF-2-diphthine--ammonia ligase)